MATETATTPHVPSRPFTGSAYLIPLTDVRYLTLSQVKSTLSQAREEERLTSITVPWWQGETTWL